jgi:hypothetical protein
MKTLNEIFDIEELIITTNRYYLGRKTISVNFWCNQLIISWNLLSDLSKTVIISDIETEFKNDDRSRRLNPDGVHPLGHDIDRENWEKVRELWFKK